MSREHEIMRYAIQLRENLGISSDAIIDDIVILIRNGGYDYFEDSFGEDFSGFSESLGSGRFLIGFNQAQYWSEKFKRFTLAHELGHVSMPAHRKILEKQRIHRSKTEYQSKDEIEREADSFAINFLAPRNKFMEEMKLKDFSRETIFYLSDYFRISHYAAVLRFVELTDLTCALIVCNDKGMTDYERRSNRMKQSFRHDLLYQQPVSGGTLTSEWISGKKMETECNIDLSEWYHDLPIEIPAKESLIDLGYNGKFLTLIEPEIADIDEYISENT